MRSVRVSSNRTDESITVRIFLIYDGKDYAKKLGMGKNQIISHSTITSDIQLGMVHNCSSILDGAVCQTFINSTAASHIQK